MKRLRKSNNNSNLIDSEISISIPITCSVRLIDEVNLDFSISLMYKDTVISGPYSCNIKDNLEDILQYLLYSDSNTSEILDIISQDKESLHDLIDCIDSSISKLEIYSH